MVVESDTKVVQRHPRRQSGTQTLDLVGTLPPEAEGIEELVVDHLHDLTEPGHPPPQAFGPASLLGVALGRMEHLRSLALKPAPMVPEKADPTLRSPRSGAALTAKKVSARGWSAVEAEPKQKPVITPVGSTAASREKPSYHPMLLDQPMSARPASHPSPRRFASLKRAWPNYRALGRDEPRPSASPPAARRSPLRRRHGSARGGRTGNGRGG
jgi:hypothetical protein